MGPEDAPLEGKGREEGEDEGELSRARWQVD